MSDRIEIQPGRAPWEPAKNASVEEVFDFWNVPVAGIIEQHSLRYVFLRLAGHEEPMSLWLYFQEPEAPWKFENDPRMTLQQLISNHYPLTLIVAMEDEGVVRVWEPDSPEEFEHHWQDAVNYINGVGPQPRLMADLAAIR